MTCARVYALLIGEVCTMHLLLLGQYPIILCIPVHPGSVPDNPSADTSSGTSYSVILGFNLCVFQEATLVRQETPAVAGCCFPSFMHLFHA
mmetsp:Transcript_144765/g.252375  ORF Transcript_144765/g.252375 Transcript_144765/m.252375 type:complete len:91 (+) Transcript_144765:390-662(+)